MTRAEQVVPYSTPMLSFERDFDHEAFHSWIIRNWTVTFIYAAVYVAVIFAGRAYMSSRPRFELRLPLIIWSCLLSIFSIVGAIRTLPEMFYQIQRYGIEESVCRFEQPINLLAFCIILSKKWPIRWNCRLRPITTRSEFNFITILQKLIYA